MSCDGTTTTTEPATTTTTTTEAATTTTGAPAPVTDSTPAPVTDSTPAPVPNPTTPTDEFVIMGYVENWKSFSDTSKFDSYTHLLYSFLTLDSAPFPDDVLDVMVLCDGCAAYENPHNWQRAKIVALMDYC